MAAFLILLSPMGDLISDSVPAGGQTAESGEGTDRGEGRNMGESQESWEEQKAGEDRQRGENRENGADQESVTGREEGESWQSGESRGTGTEEKKDFIKWVDFQVTKEALEKAFRYDVDTCQSRIHLSWIELLACLGARYGGDFSRYKAADMESIAQRLMDGEKMEDITADMKYYAYYLEAYTAVLGGMVGEFKVEIPASKAPDFVLKAGGETEDGGDSEEDGDRKVWVTKYGLKAFSPIAKNYPYNDYDDFGAARSYGFKRQHLGHDMMGQVGTPVIAVESGYVEAMGWNQYGGWRLGIRSFDGKRYYYYAHLRKNYPYHKSLQEGSVVQAGDVIGYLGRTGYSRTENTKIGRAHV